MAGRDVNTVDPVGEIDSTTGEEWDEISVTVEKEIIHKFQKKKEVNIFVAGRTGVGKTTLVDSILDGVLHKARHGPSPTKQCCFERCEGTVIGVPLNLYDTRGFGAIKTAKADAEQVLEALRKEFSPKSDRSIDLCIFCQEMFGRFDEGSLKVMESFGDFITDKGWEVSIVALTKANILPVSIIEAEDRKREMEKVTKEMKRTMQDEFFSKHGLFKISEGIPFIPVGCKTKKNDMSKLECETDSIQALKLHAINRCKLDATTTLTTAFTKWRIKITLGVGAGVGAAIGAVASIPSGGRAAITGVVLGGAVGAVAASTGLGAKEAIGYVLRQKVKNASE